MTIQEFDNTGWTCGMNAEYHGKTYKVASCDFDEKIIGLLGVILNAPEEISWVRCENVTLIPPNNAHEPLAGAQPTAQKAGKTP